MCFVSAYFLQICLELDGPWFTLVWNVFESFHFFSDTLHWACYGSIGLTDVAIGFLIIILEEFRDVG